MKKIHSVLVVLICIFFVPASARSFDKAQYEILRKGVKAWNAMRAGAGTGSYDLSGAVLKGKNLRGIDLNRTDLRGADLTDADLSDAVLDDAILDRAVAKNTLFYDAFLRRASLRGADLEEAGFEGADLRDAVLDEAVLKQADMSSVILRGASLRGVDLRASVLNAADLAGADLDGAYLWRADLDGANLNGAVVTVATIVETGDYADREWAADNRAVLKAAPGVKESVKQEKKSAGETVNEAAPSAAGTAVQETAGTEASSSVLEQVRLNPVGTSGADIPGNRWPVNPVAQKIQFGVSKRESASIPYDAQQRELLTDNVPRWNKTRVKNPEMKVRLAGANLNRKMLDGADLRNADLNGTLMKGADLTDADLRGADLRGANLRAADLTRADFRGADLRGTYLWMANTSWTLWNYAVVNAATVLHTGKNASPEWAEENGAVYRGD